MRILLCNERFLFRFGVDRVLLVLGKYFREMGHEVIMMGNRLDEQAVNVCSDRFIPIPQAAPGIEDNGFTLDWLKDNWDKLFADDDKPDIALIAGWPFYLSIGFIREKCGHAIFHDYGAVPMDEMNGGELEIQKRLRSFRRDHLSEANEIIAISDFLVCTQSKEDSKGLIPIESCLLGVDHMELGLWKSEDLINILNGTVDIAKKAKHEGYKLLLVLGRWEPGTYKNSQAAFDVLRALKKIRPDRYKLAALSGHDDMNIPEDLLDDVIPLGFVDDDDLQELMRISDVGVHMSKWEGFNLPLGEMQLLGQPVFCFNEGAHPEVAIDRYFLCRDNADMAEKLALELDGKTPLPKEKRKENLDRFRSYFTWKRCASEMIDIFTRVLCREQLLIIDTTNACHDTANTGVMRVTRKIARNVQTRVETLYVLWDTSIKTYVFPYDDEVALLCNYGGPESGLIKNRSVGGFARTKFDERDYKGKKITLLVTETINAEHFDSIRCYVKESGLRIAVIFHDAIPVRYPQFCNPEVTLNHIKYMKGLAECDLILPNSKASEKDLDAFWKENCIDGTLNKEDELAGELDGVERAKEVSSFEPSKIKILCVGTLEPRKNHIRLMDAAIKMGELHPDLDWSLTLIGNIYAGREDVRDYVLAASKKQPRIQWLGIVDDETLHRLYNEATFTVYPSVIEGYGMPIMESIWNGKPCICSNSGVMSELASGGGGYTVNVTNTDAINEAMFRLATDSRLRRELEYQCVSRHIKTWTEYTLTLLDRICSIKSKVRQDIEFTSLSSYLFGRDTNDIAEVLIVSAIARKLQPECALCIGNIPKEYIQAVSENSKVTFLVSSDETSRSNCVGLQETTFICGTIGKVICIIEEELKSVNMDVSLLIIGGTDGLAGSLEWFRKFVPLIPTIVLFIVNNESKNFELNCETDFCANPYLQNIDKEFFYDSKKRGGLALAYLIPKNE